MNRTELQQIFTDFIKGVQVDDYTKKYYSLYGNYSDKVVVTVEVGGASGGNCWNDNPARSYERDTDEITSDISDALFYQFMSVGDQLDIPRDRVVQVCKNLAQDLEEVGSRHESEYYGNYTTHNAYAVEISKFFKEVLYVIQYEIFAEALEKFNQVAEVDYRYNTLTERKGTLTAKLDKLTSERLKEKSTLEREIKRLQGILAVFDNATDHQKTVLVSELEQVNRELEEFSGR